ncbi:hypothetical protein HUJ05_001850 [Dendroctonus ponderosae]|nr:hypothetical protein HUJ05_001850 [Dendroctonus ponderosae]
MCNSREKIKPAEVYPGKRCLVQPIAELGDIPGPSHEYVHVTSNIATVPGSKDTLSRESSSNNSARMAPELCTPKKFKGVRILNLKAVGITQQKHLSPRNKILYEGVNKLNKLVHRQEVEFVEKALEVIFALCRQDSIVSVTEYSQAVVVMRASLKYSRCRLPRNENLRSIWIRRARCEDLVAKLKFRSVFMCSRHFHVVCFKANGFQGAPSIENSFYRESIPSARGCVTPEKNQDGVCMVESNTILTHTSPLESVIKPAKVYPGKRRLVQPIAEISPQFRNHSATAPRGPMSMVPISGNLEETEKKFLPAMTAPLLVHEQKTEKTPQREAQ